MAQGYYVIRTYECGAVGEKIKYWVPGEKPQRMTRRASSDVAQQARNDRNSVRAAARLFHCNFSAGDYCLELDYSDKGLARIKRGAGFVSEFAILDAAAHEFSLLVRRVNRELSRLGLPNLKAFWITSDLDGETGEVVRVHHHAVIPADQRVLKVIRDKWSCCGYVGMKELRHQDDYTPLIEYFRAQVRNASGEAWYSVTRGNFVRPVPVDRIAKGGGLLRAPQGSELLFMSEVRRFEGGNSPQYIRYTLPARRRKKNKRPIPEDGEGE